MWSRPPQFGKAHLADGVCECMLVRFSAVQILSFTLSKINLVATLLA